MSEKQIFRSQDLNGQSVTGAESVELLSNASSPDHAVKLSQTQQIADDAVQNKLVVSTAQASTDTAFTSSTMQGFLSGKQDNMEIETSSAAYMEIVDGYKIKVKQLLISDVEVDETYGSLASYIAGVSPSKQQGDVVILNAAIDNQERSWIKTGAASQGADGYTRLQTDYNVSSIRAMFSAGQYMTYSAATGQFSVDLGTASYELGAHNLPVSSSEFNVVSGNNILDIAKALETLVSTGQQTQQQETQTVDTRISSCTGVSGSNLGSFGGRFSNDSTIKAVLQEAETEIANSETANTTLRQDMNSADATLQSNINSANSSRLSGDASVTSASIARDNTLQGNIDTVDAALTSEASTRLSSDNALDARLDIVEGSSTTTGSIAKAQADAQAFATSAVSSEAAIRSAADANLQTQIDSISDAFHYKGYINSEGRVVHIDPTNANNNALFETAALANGDFYKVNAAITITFGDSSAIDVEAGDGLLSINDVASGSSTASDIHKTDNTEAADLLREGMLDGVTIEKSGGSVKVIDDSIGRTQLAADVETDIDDKVSLTQSDNETSFGNTHSVVSDSLGNTDGTQLKYSSLDSTNTDAPLGTQRMFLDIHKVYSGGSGNPFDSAKAVVRTQELEYHGDCQDFSQVVTVDNAELNFHNSAAKTLGTARISRASGGHLGISIGHTAAADGSLLQNIGNTAFAQAIGVSSDVGEHGVLSDLDLETFAQWLAVNPLAVGGAPLDAAVVGDARSATSGYAVAGLGRPSYFDPTQPVVMPSSSVAGSTEASPVIVSDVKAKQKIYSFDLVDGVAKVISTPAGIDLDKCIWRVVDNFTDVDLSVVLDDGSKEISVTATGDSLTGVKLLLQELSCDVESV